MNEFVNELGEAGLSFLYHNQTMRPVSVVKEEVGSPSMTLESTRKSLFLRDEDDDLPILRLKSQ